MHGPSDQERSILQDSVARFAQRQVVPHLESLNHYPDRRLPDGLVRGMDELGLFGLLLPADEGGGASLAELSVALEALAEKAAAAAALLFAHSLAQQLVASASGERGRERLFGSAGAAPYPVLAYPAYAEPADCTHGICARKEGGGLVLEGTCEFVANAPIAHLLLLPVYPEEGNGEGRCSLALLEAAREGLCVGEPLLTLGLRGAPVADVTLRGVRVSAEELIPGACELIGEVAARFRGPAAAICAGIAGASLRTATGYAQERYQGGRHIIEHQQVRALLAGMLSDYQACREAADRLSGERGPAESEAATLFVRAKEGAARATTDGVQLLGGYGYMEDYGQERCMRDAKQAQCLLGRCALARQEQIGEWLGREGAV